MYVNPVIVGVVGTLVAEIVGLVVWALIANSKKK